MSNPRRGLAGLLLAALLAANLLWAGPGHGAGSPPAAASVIEGVLRQRTLFGALTAYGIPPSEVLALTRALKPVFDFRNARPQDRYRIGVDVHNNVHHFVYATGPLDEYEAIRDGHGGYRVSKRKIAMERRITSRVFTIDTSLYQAVADQGESHALAGEIADLFAWDIDFFLYPRKGDRIAVVYERCYKKEQFLQYGKILAASYVGQRKRFTAIWFDDGQAKGYYDDAGRPLKKMFLRTPLRFARQTSSFSIRRFHPLSRRYKAHTGIDYGAASGTPILATANGRVTFAGRKGGYGKLMILTHANGYQTYYGHCSRLLKKTGQRVRQNEVIAQVGRTGLATGPHVHYEVRVNGTPINPNRVKKVQGRPLSQQRLALFRPLARQQLARMEDLLEKQGELVMLTP